LYDIRIRPGNGAGLFYNPGARTGRHCKVWGYNVPHFGACGVQRVQCNTGLGSSTQCCAVIDWHYGHSTARCWLGHDSSNALERLHMNGLFCYATTQWAPSPLHWTHPRPLTSRIRTLSQCSTASGRIKEKPVGGTTRRGAVGAENRGAEGAEGGGVWGRGVPLPTGGGVW